MIYRTKDGDMLDRICLQYYGRSDDGVVEAVLEANTNLGDKGPVYDAGVKITLPDLDVSTAETDSIRLWD